LTMSAMFRAPCLSRNGEHIDGGSDDSWYRGSLSIDPRQQNEGLGRKLLAAAEDWVRERGGREIRMTVVNIRDTLIAWYLRCGYVLTSETEPLPTMTIGSA
jgi:GNAT superfamily N-acetyltransferase